MTSTISPRESDVLCGKTRQCLVHHGSIQFRNLIESYSERYEWAEDKYSKMALTREIYNLVSKTSRFLRYNQKQDSWEELSPATARDKVGHALRFSASRRNKARRRPRPAALSGEHSQKTSVSAAAPLPLQIKPAQGQSFQTQFPLNTQADKQGQVQSMQLSQQILEALVQSNQKCAAPDGTPSTSVPVTTFVQTPIVLKAKAYPEEKARPEMYVKEMLPPGMNFGGNNTTLDNLLAHFSAGVKNCNEDSQAATANPAAGFSGARPLLQEVPHAVDGSWPSSASASPVPVSESSALNSSNFAFTVVGDQGTLPQLTSAKAATTSSRGKGHGQHFNHLPIPVSDPGIMQHGMSAGAFSNGNGNGHREMVLNHVRIPLSAHGICIQDDPVPSSGVGNMHHCMGVNVIQDDEPSSFISQNCVDTSPVDSSWMDNLFD